MPDIACIFDMDGVLLDNREYHKKAWSEFLKKYTNKENFDYEKIMSEFFGRTNLKIFEYLFDKNISTEELAYWEDVKESLYREITAPVITPLPGLIPFLQNLHDNKIPIAVGTSGPLENVNFVLDAFNIKNLFSAIVDSNQVSKGKPDPEVFLKCAEQLNITSGQCIVFEDSFSGIEAGIAAGMKVVGVATEHTQAILLQKGATVAINDFRETDIEKISALCS